MAAIDKTVFTYAEGLGDTVYSYPDMSGTADDDIAGGVATVRAVEIDMSANTAEDVTVRFYDNAAPTVGTDNAAMWFRVKKGTGAASNRWMFLVNGYEFTNISMAAVREKGGGAGATSPSGTVQVRLILA